jgi:phospholipase C
MIIYSKRTEWWRRAAVGASLFALLFSNFSAFGENRPANKADHLKTATPIKHVIVLIGENRTFDHLFATYVPRKGERVSNLLSKGIINGDGTPGPNFSLAQQFQAVAPFQTEYFISLSSDQKAPYSILPEPTLNFSPTAPFFAPGTPTSLLAAVEPSLERQSLNLLTTGAATGFSQTFILPDPDTRVANFNNLPNGPFALRGPQLPYDSYTGDTTHRLFEMWQQSDCNITNATPENPSGCLNDLYPFVITTYTNQFDPFFGGIDDNGGGNSIAFYNVQKGDVPFLKHLASEF